MRIAVLGAGPSGLLFALLAKRRQPAWEVQVFEQNPPDATFGFGVVFSQGALAFLGRDAPDLYRQLLPRMETWPMQRIVHRDERVDIDGNGFSSIARLELNRFLAELCFAAGVHIAYRRVVAALEDLPAADLVVAADGANSVARRALAPQFGPHVELLTNRFAWYGTEQPFDCLTLTFRESGHGVFVAHHYRYAPGLSTFLVECDAATWQAAGFGDMSDEESRATCERVFAADLGGHPLLSNKSVWRQFPLIGCRSWTGHSGSTPVVLLGDALRTVHFSIGSGTRLAFEDAIALDRAFGEAGADVPGALAAFERERRPVVEKIVVAANASSYWYESMGERMARFDALGLAYDYMTRSGRMTDARLAELAPAFMARIDRQRGGK